jgi:hypothetical protein
MSDRFQKSHNKGENEHKCCYCMHSFNSVNVYTVIDCILYFASHIIKIVI